MAVSSWLHTATVLLLTLGVTTAGSGQSYRSGYIDREGKIVIPATFESARDFSDDRAVVELPLWNLYGAIDTNGTMVVPAEFSWIGGFSEGLAPARGPDGSIGYIDRQGNWVITPTFASGSGFSEGLAQVDVVREEPWALLSAWIDSSGEVVVGPLEFRNAGPFTEGVARVRSDEGWALIDREGNTLADGYDTMFATQDGLIPVREGEKWGFIDIDGKEAVPPKYMGALPFSEGLAPVKASRGWSFIDTSDATIIAGPFEAAYPFAEGLAAVQLKERWGFINRSGGVVVEPSFDEVRWHSEGLAPVRVGELWGFFDKSGVIVIEPSYSSVDPFSEGRARFTIQLPATERLAEIEREADWARQEMLSQEAKDPALVRTRLETTQREVEKLGEIIPPEPHLDRLLESLQAVASRSAVSLRVTPLEDTVHDGYFERQLLLELEGSEHGRAEFVERCDYLARLVGPLEELESDASSARVTASIYWIPRPARPSLRLCQRVTLTSDLSDAETQAGQTLNRMCDELDQHTEARQAELELDLLYKQINTTTMLVNAVNDSSRRSDANVRGDILNELGEPLDLDALLDETTSAQDPDGPPLP